MRKLLFVLLVSSLVLTVAFAGHGRIPTAQAASPDIFQGNLVLTGNNVTVIEGRFDINGNIIVEDNATLILRNAVVNFTQTSPLQFSMTLQNPTNGNPRLIIENTTLVSGGYSFIVNFFANSSCMADQVSASQDNVHFWLYDSSHVSMSNTNVFAVIHYGGSFEAKNSSINQFQLFQSGSANISSSYLENLLDQGSADVIVTNSTINAVQSTYESALIQLVNSTYNYHNIVTGRVTVSWYLDVHVVDQVAQNVPNANVTVTYANATVAESKSTDTNGLTRLTLMEKMLNASGQYPVGNYTVKATNGIYSNGTTINMTGNQEITLTLIGLIVTEIQSWLVLPLFVTLTLVVIIVYRRRHSMNHVEYKTQT